MARAWAIVEREMRRFRRSPTLIVMSLIFPLMQLVILGYAFGGNVKHLKLGVVDQDHGCRRSGSASWRRRWRPTRGPSTPLRTRTKGEALDDLRDGRINGVLTIPPDYSRRVLAKERRAWRSSRTTATTS